MSHFLNPEAFAFFNLTPLSFRISENPPPLSASSVPLLAGHLLLKEKEKGNGIFGEGLEDSYNIRVIVGVRLKGNSN
jgi:hypothetical protein